MCGIAGIFNFNGQSVRQDQLSAMTDRMVERGPDDDGFYLSGSVGLGFRRLSIIDVAGGHQPLCNEDASLQLVFNGEIYNHIELRDQLVSLGHVFRTKSDAEVVLHLYEEKGVKSLEDLNGMFAFALFDKYKNAVWVARDRFGIKPLFYSLTSKEFIFSSDIRALRTAFTTEIDSQSILKYLALGYVPGTNSMWKGVRKLAPAHYLWVDIDKPIKCERYWSLGSTKSWRGSTGEAMEHLNDLLSNAIALQMRSDVPIGIFLSGGVDSSALVAYASEHTNAPLRTFTIDFSGKGSCDAKYAQLVSEIYKTRHTELKMDAATALLAIYDLLKRIDEPISDSAIFPAYLLSVTAREQGVKVLLNGAGGDEIFGGYARYFPPRIGSPSWVAEMPLALCEVFSSLLGMLQPQLGMRAANPLLAWASGLSGIDFITCKHLLRKKFSFDRLTSAIYDEFNDLAVSTNSDNYSYTRMEMDLQTYLPGDVLSLTDKASMAASVECRVPLLDHRLVEFAFSLPSEINLLAGNSKGLFKEVLRSSLPKELLNRKKEGFNMPIAGWLKAQGALRLEDEFSGGLAPVLDELIDSNNLNALLTNGLKSSYASETLFSIFLLNRWCLEQ